MKFHSPESGRGGSRSLKDAVIAATVTLLFKDERSSHLHSILKSITLLMFLPPLGKSLRDSSCFQRCLDPFVLFTFGGCRLSLEVPAMSKASSKSTPIAREHMVEKFPVSMWEISPAS